MKVKSVTNVITNSSSETFLVVNENAIDTVKNFINAILGAAGSEKTCDELFDVTPIKIKPKSGVDIPDLDGINNIFCSEERYC